MPDWWPPYSTASASFTGAPVLTVLNGSRSGSAISYLGDATRLPKLCPDYGQAVAFLSTSHNETGYGKKFLTLYETWRAAVQARLPQTPIVVLTQNPQTSGATTRREHADRRMDLLGYARTNSVDIIDTYRAFIDAGFPGALMTDTVHPNAAGEALWRDTVKAVFDASA